MSVTQQGVPGRACAGVDWAKDDHAIAIIDPDGQVLDRFTVTHDAAGLKSLVRRLLAAGVDEVGIERGDGPVVEALIQAELTVLVIPPAQLKNLRSRYGSAGNKDDRYDAYILADVVRTDRRRLRPLVRDSAATTALRTTVRARRDLIEHRIAAANQLRAHLQIVFPGATSLFAAIDSAISLTFLERFTTQAQADWLSPKRLGRWLSSVSYSGHTDPEIPHTRLLAAPHGTTGAQAQTHTVTTLAFVAILRSLNIHIEALASSIGEQLAIHPDAHTVTSLPRSGTVRAARLLAEIGDARGRFPTADSLACLAGVAPSTRQSGKVKATPSGGEPTKNSETPSATSPATPATPTPGPHTSTPRPGPGDTTTSRRPNPRPGLGAHHLAHLARQHQLRPHQTQSPPCAAQQHHQKSGLNDARLTQGNSCGPSRLLKFVA
jgi:transposase